MAVAESCNPYMLKENTPGTHRPVRKRRRSIDLDTIAYNIVEALRAKGLADNKLLAVGALLQDIAKYSQATEGTLSELQSSGFSTQDIDKLSSFLQSKL